MFLCFNNILFSFLIFKFSSDTFSSISSHFSILVLFSSEANLDFSNFSSRSSTLLTFHATLDPREEKLSSRLFNKGSYKEDETEWALKINRTFSSYLFCWVYRNALWVEAGMLRRSWRHAVGSVVWTFRIIASCHEAPSLHIRISCEHCLMRWPHHFLIIWSSWPDLHSLFSFLRN